MLSKTSPINVIKGFPTDDNESQKRIIHGHYQYGSETIHVINGYFPQGENRSHPTKFPAKEKFYSDLGMYMRDNLKQNDYVVVMGDMNVAPKNIDVGIGPDNMKRWLQRGICCFLPEERTWLDSIMSFPLFDTYRHLHCNDLEYSWFDYRSRGFDQDPKRGLRIDLILSSQSLLPRMIGAGIAFLANYFGFDFGATVEQSINVFVDNVKDLIRRGFDLIKGLFTGEVSFGDIVTKVTKLLTDLVTGTWAWFSGLFDFSTVSSGFASIINLITLPYTILEGLIKGVWGWFKGLFGFKDDDTTKACLLYTSDAADE